MHDIYVESHNDRGVKSVEYGVVAEVLLWALRYTIGNDAYTPQVHYAWIKIISRMLSVMIPVAVKFEMESGIAQKHRMDSLTNSSALDKRERSYHVLDTNSNNNDK